MGKDDKTKGSIWEQWAARSDQKQEFNINELAREIAGDSPRHLMILAEDDPHEKEKRADQKRREQAAAAEQARELLQRQAELLARIDAQIAAVDKRRKEIEDNAIRLRDGRRVYVDGNQFRDGEGRVLFGADEAEAAQQHEHKPNASTWQDKKQADDYAARLGKMRDKVAQGNQDTASLSTAEREFNDEVKAEAARQAKEPIPDYSDTSLDEYSLSTVPAFTDAAKLDGKTVEKKETDVADAKTAPRLLSQGAFKLG